MISVYSIGLLVINEPTLIFKLLEKNNYFVFSGRWSFPYFPDSTPPTLNTNSLSQQKGFNSANLEHFKRTHCVTLFDVTKQTIKHLGPTQLGLKASWVLLSLYVGL